MSALEKSLLCLRHPVTLLSIGLLLINDHVLKVVAPSWVTGKLSDLAGLFFFPFVLIALLSLVLDRLHVPVRRTGMIAFMVTAVWFSLIKLVPPVNAATEELLNHLLGIPVQIILDSSDLMALPVLIPAWRLWETVKPMSSNRLGWFALGIASLATLATTPPPPWPVVFKVISQNGLLYATAPPAKSDDGGKTWIWTEAFPGEAGSRQLPIVVCDSPRTQVCYRIFQKEQIEKSQDGGQTWQVVWNIPAGRRDFMQRLLEAQCYGGLLCWEIKKLDIGPYDFTFADPVGNKGLHTLVVAMGNEGIMLGTPGGEWERYAVLRAEPTPMSASNLSDAIRPILIEIELWYIVACLVLVGLTLYSVDTILASGTNPSVEQQSSWAARPTYAVIVIILLVYLGLFFAGAVSNGLSLLMPFVFIWFWPIGLAPLCLVPLGTVLTWDRIGNVLQQARLIRGFAVCIMVAVCTFVAGSGPLILWTLGIIPVYQNALTVSIVIGGSIVLFGIRQIQKLALSVVNTSSSA